MLDEQLDSINIRSANVRLQYSKQFFWGNVIVTNSKTYICTHSKNLIKLNLFYKVIKKSFNLFFNRRNDTTSELLLCLINACEIHPLLSAIL